MQGVKIPLCLWAGGGRGSDASRAPQRSYGTVSLGNVQRLPELGSWATWLSWEIGSDFAAGPVLGRWLDQMTSRGPFLPKLFYDIEICVVLYLMWECLEAVNKILIFWLLWSNRLRPCPSRGALLILAGREFLPVVFKLWFEYVIS